MSNISILTSKTQINNALCEGGGLRFLIIDDQRNARKTIRNMLNVIGYVNIGEAGDGDIAIDKLINGVCDFVICDWNMPLTTGVDVLKAVRNNEKTRDIPFLMVTAESDASRIIDAAELEVDGYIIKPFFANTLESKIKQILYRKLNPSELDQVLNQASSCCSGGDCSDAIQLFEDALRLKPESARIRHLMGECYKHLGDTDKALDVYEMAHKLNPQYIKVHQVLCDIYIEKGAIEKAIEVAEKTTILNTNNPKKQIMLGELYLIKGDTGKAEEVFKKAISVSSGNPEIITEIGDIYFESKNNDKAIEVYRIGLGVKRDVCIYNRIGIALRKAGKPLNAIEEYKKAILITPRDAVLHFNVGKAYLEADNKKEAEKSFTTALQLDSEFEECKEAIKKLNKNSKAK